MTPSPPTPLLLRARALAFVALVPAATLIAIPAAVSAGAPRACAPSADLHTVEAGESWYRIADGAGIPIRALLAANSASEDRPLLVGSIVCVPSGSTSSPSSSTSTAATASPTSQGTARSCAAGDSAREVVPGDSWFDISRDAEVSLRALLAANSATASTVLYPGDALCIPSTTVETTTTSSAGARSSSTSATKPRQRCDADEATHTVASGDSWFELASRNGITAKSLLNANDSSSDDALHPGATICIPATTAANALAPASSGLVRALPVQGPCSFVDSWRAPRGGGRRHEGVDLIAKPGQYVYAVTDGTLSSRAWARPGTRAGNAWWLTAADGSGTYYFYAHLSAFAPDLEVGSTVKAGQIIGFIGSTGNAAGPHLHFEIHPGGGAAINPYPAVKAAGGCRTGAGYQQPGGWVPSGG